MAKAPICTENARQKFDKGLHWMHKIDTVMLQASQNKFHGHESLQMYMSNKNVIKIMIAWSASVRVRNNKAKDGRHAEISEHVPGLGIPPYSVIQEKGPHQILFLC